MFVSPNRKHFNFALGSRMENASQNPKLCSTSTAIPSVRISVSAQARMQSPKFFSILWGRISNYISNATQLRWKVSDCAPSTDLQSRKCVGAVVCRAMFIWNSFILFRRMHSMAELRFFFPTFLLMHWIFFFLRDRATARRRKEKFCMKLLIKFHDESCYKMLVK